MAIPTQVYIPPFSPLWLTVSRGLLVYSGVFAVIFVTLLWPDGNSSGERWSFIPAIVMLPVGIGSALFEARWQKIKRRRLAVFTEGITCDAVVTKRWEEIYGTPSDFVFEPHWYIELHYRIADQDYHVASRVHSKMYYRLRVGSKTMVKVDSRNPTLWVWTE